MFVQESYADKRLRKDDVLYVNVLKVNLSKTLAAGWASYVYPALDIFLSLFHPASLA